MGKIMIRKVDVTGMTSDCHCRIAKHEGRNLEKPQRSDRLLTLLPISTSESKATPQFTVYADVNGLTYESEQGWRGQNRDIGSQSLPLAPGKSIAY